MPAAGRPADRTSTVLRPLDEPPSLDHPLSAPPSSYISSARKAKKRSSEEFEIDQFGMLVSKHLSSKDDDRSLARKHRSLNVNPSTSTSSRDPRTKERKRGSTGVSPHKTSAASPRAVDRHARQVSAGSMTAGFNESHVPRRGLSNDFSHLSSPQSAPLTQPEPIAKSSSHSAVAHSVLRGPQEGWSELDDEATAEALRKLDGLSGKTARARSSFSSLGRHSNSSRPPTPDHSKTKRGTKESGNAKDKDRDSLRLAGAGAQKASVPDYHNNVASSDDQHSTSAAYEKTPKKMVSPATRSSFTPKRGSTSSTNYTSTTTSSSRDSASVSISTSLTSMSANSGRYSTGKVRRDSAGSDNVHFSEPSIKERNLSVTNGDFVDDAAVPPVPPLPKDLSSYRSPQSALSGPPLPPTSEEPSPHVGAAGKDASPLVPDAPVIRNSQANVSSTLSRRQSQHILSAPASAHSAPESSPSVPKTPSKKWSFSALNLKLSGSPSSTSKTPFPLSPRSAFGSRPKSSSRDQGGHSPGQRRPWSPEQPHAMDSDGSLASMSSVQSTQNPTLRMHPSKTPDALIIPSRSSTASSASISNTTPALVAPQSGPLSPTSPNHRNQSKRLTPSSIPFFRRSSSQSMQVPPSFIMSSSPTFSSSGVQTPSNRKNNGSPSGERQQASASAPASSQKKSSVLSLGFPSLLKSSSRRSLHSDSKDSAKEQKGSKESEKEKKQKKDEKDKHKKDDKDRSESRISLLMGGRRRGKVVFIFARP